MRSHIARFVMLGAFTSLGACSTLPSENYLDAGARQHINSVDAVLISKQSQIGADIKRNQALVDISALASGVTIIPLLLEAGVSGVRTINAQNMVKPMREKLEGHDFPSEIRSQIRQSLAGTTFEDVKDFKILRNEYPGMRGSFIAESEADAVLMIDMKYAFSPSFETLYVQSHAMVFPKRPELKVFQEKPDTDKTIEFSDNIYRNQYTVGISSGLKEASKEEHAAKWAELPQEKLIEALDVAALVLADTMANDMSLDDVESDLDLIPDGYALNTKYQNLNQKYASIRSGESILQTPQESADDAAQIEPKTDVEDALDAGASSETNAETRAVVIDGKTGS